MRVTMAQVVFAICVCASVFFQIAQGSVLHIGKSGNLGIFGGHPVSIEEVPYMAEIIHVIKRYSKLMCGGSIIHVRFILTAAHCVKHSGEVQVYAIFGTDNLLDSLTTIEVEKQIRHEGYTPGVYYEHDIALFKLQQSVQIGPNWPKVGLVKLADKDVPFKEGDNVTACGWGYTGSTTDDGYILRQVIIPIISDELCLSYYGNLTGVFCAGSDRNGPCLRDSGTPIMYDGKQIGVVSGGLSRFDGCGVSEIGGINTKVTSYLQWINVTISNNL